MAMKATTDNCACCQHPMHAHEHYRRGTDCSTCSCSKFRRRRWLVLWDRRREIGPVHVTIHRTKEINV